MEIIKTTYRDLKGNVTAGEAAITLWDIEGLDLWKVEPIILDFS